MLLLYKVVPDLHTWEEALFAGWFGPMGVGAAFISTLALTHLPAASDNPANQAELLTVIMQPIVAFTILGSILIHGLSIPAFSVAKWVNTMTLSRTATAQVSSQPEWMNQLRNWLPAPPAPTLDQPQQEVTADVERNDSIMSNSPKMQRLSDRSQFTSRSPSLSTIQGLSTPPLKSVAFAAPSDSATHLTSHSRRGSRAATRPPSPLLEQEAIAGAEGGSDPKHSTQNVSCSGVNDDVGNANSE